MSRSGRTSGEDKCEWRLLSALENTQCTRNSALIAADFQDFRVATIMVRIKMPVWAQVDGGGVLPRKMGIKERGFDRLIVISGVAHLRLYVSLCVV